MGRDFWIRLFLFLHVMGAIAAVGPTLTYGMWLARAEREGPGQRAFAVRTVSWVDGHLATPAFMTQAVTGVALLLLLKLSVLHTAWLLTGIVLYVITVVFAVSLYAPVVRRQVDLAQRIAAAPEDPVIAAGYVPLARRATLMGMVAVVLTLGILVLMITKPALWSVG